MVILECIKIPPTLAINHKAKPEFKTMWKGEDSHTFLSILQSILSKVISFLWHKNEKHSY